jgi:hypothetical protein
MLVERKMKMKIDSRRMLAAACLAAFMGVGCASQTVTGPELDRSSAAGEDLDSLAAGGVDKVLICHIPPGNPDNRHDIVVGAPAVPAHLAHGDFVGTCDDPCLTATGLGTTACRIGR